LRCRGGGSSSLGLLLGLLALLGLLLEEDVALLALLLLGCCVPVAETLLVSMP